jgi:hypothetical protein
MNLIEIDLGKEGVEYLSHWLGGERGLCTKLARQLARGGDVFAPLPAGTSLDRASEFRWGGLLAWRETCAWFDREIEQLRGRADKGSLVFQDVWFTPQDAVRGGFDGALFDQSSVYYVLGPHEINAAAISGTVRRLHSFLLQTYPQRASWTSLSSTKWRIAHRKSSSVRMTEKGWSFGEKVSICGVSSLRPAK